MMVKWVLVVIMTSVLWTTCLSQNECTSTISNTTDIIFTCLSNVTINELPLYNYTTGVLSNITSIVVNGINSTTTGPFTSIPPNICLLPNLRIINFSNNRITQVDPAGVVNRCLSNAITLDVSYNTITDFPSAMIYNMPTLQNLYFQHNQLTDVPSNAFLDASNLATIDFSYNNLTTFELWALLVKTSADFSHNGISTITNKRFFKIPQNTATGLKKVYLNNNNPTINLTDAIFEMYNSCEEVIEKLSLTGNEGLNVSSPISSNLIFIDFGTTQINCNCDQYYILQMLYVNAGDYTGLAGYPIYNATCTSGIQFLNSSCAAGLIIHNPTVDFSQVYPRQCKILESEAGNLTNFQNISAPILNVSTYPYYDTELMNPGACFFTFSSTTMARIKCTNDIASSSTIPSVLLSNTYFSNITRIDFTTSISSLPAYICSLPSRVIDLSFESFTTLSDATFPCLNSFNKVTLSNNQLTSVNMASGNFTNLMILDLSSNKLTTLPYSILTPTPSSLRYLDLRNNSITSIDLFLYTLKNITVDLRDNPINSSSIINPQNITIPSGNNTNSTVIITLPPSVTASTYIFNDQTALTAGTCNRNTVLAYRDTLQSTYSNVLLDCTCASINLKEIFLRSGADILSSFNCSNGTTAASYSSLTMSSCASTALNFASGLCYNESLQTSTDDTTMGVLNATIQTTSTYLTILINSSLSSKTTPNHQYTNVPESEETGLDLHTSQTANSSNQLSTISFETITPKYSSDSNATSVSATYNINQMGTSSSISIATSRTTTSFLSTTLLIINTTAIITDSDTMISIGWTTTTTTTTTSTSSSSSSSTTSTSTSTSSTSTSTSTTRTTTSTSTSSSTSTTRTTTSTSTSSSSSTTSTSTSTSTSSTSTSTSTTGTTTSTSSTSTSSTSTSTSTTSTTTSTSSSSSTTTTSTSSTSRSTSTSSTSATTSTSSSSTSTSSSTSVTPVTTVTTTTATTSVTTTTITTRSDASVPLGSAGSNSDASRTGLIVGLVLGLVGFFALIGGLIAAIVIAKSKGAVASKSIGRATAISQAPEDALLTSRLQTRNSRAVRLAPLATQPSQLPPSTYGSGVPVTVTKDPSTSAFNTSNLRASLRGIPTRLDPIRSPSNIVPQYAPHPYTSDSSFNFQPSNSASIIQRPLPQQPFQEPRARQPRPTQLLNAGGDTRY